ncbi:porin [Candidatus Pelagibacter ubique]|nr:porin [Candidatus Pelagibacter ubique]
MKTITKGINMNDMKKIGLTALAGSLVAFSANAAEMSVSGATMLTYTSEDTTEVTGNPFGMKTNLAFTASGEVNGYTVSYLQVSADQFAGMSSARLSVDMGDMGTLAFDQGSGSGLATIDDKTPTAAEEIWDGLDTAGSSAGAQGLVGAAGSKGVFNYINTFGGVTFNGAARRGSGSNNSDGASSAAGQSAWDFALTTDGSMLGVDGLAMGVGYGEAENGSAADTTPGGDDEHMTAFANYSMGPVTFGYQVSNIDKGGATAVDQEVAAWGLAFNVNENLSVSYGERDVTFKNPSAADVEESGEGIAIAYTMGSMKIAGNRNEVSNNDNSAGTNDEMTEIAVSFAF